MENQTTTQNEEITVPIPENGFAGNSLKNMSVSNDESPPTPPTTNHAAAAATPDYLSKKNVHPRDALITFEEGPHIYTVMGDRGGYTSVTTWVHNHFSHFDSDKIINKILKSKKWSTDPSYKYYKMTKEDIKKMWDNNRDAAACAGTNMHRDIEYFYNELDIVNESTEYKYFLDFQKEHLHLTPYRTEWMVFHEELKISGSIDMIFENPDGTLQIFDWKRCNEIVKENNFNEYSKTQCISHLPDTNYWHYSLQLNMYKRILEDKYEKKITDLFLICLHPNNSSYLKIEVPILKKEMDDLIKYRKKELGVECTEDVEGEENKSATNNTNSKFGGFVGSFDG